LDPDISLRRIERTAVALCLGLAIAALAVPRVGVAAAGAVLGGGLLALVSYWTMKRSVSRLVARAAGSSASHGRGGFILTVVGRYALLVFLAYVMIARLRLHPLGLLIGASSVVMAVVIEAIRLQVNKS
jgi:hypothetical protein